MKVSNPYQYSFFTVLLSICLLFVIPPEETFSQDNDTHTVREGDTLFSISRQYDITVGELREWNDLEGESLSMGMRLRISPPEQQDAVTHTVTSQETLFSISRNYGVTIAEIQDWNNLENTILSVGQELTIYTQTNDGAEELPEPQSIPEPEDEESEARESMVSPAAAASTYYTVKSGDYLNRIAAEHGMTTEELRQLNNLDGDMLNVGQRLIVRESQSTPVVDEEFEESTPQGRFVNYRLESGEDTETLLNRFSMTLEELESLNPGTNVSSLNSGQRVTVLLPASRTFRNPYRKGAGLQDLGDVLATRYDATDAAAPTTSGELHNPSQLTAAHASIALGRIVYVENPENGRGVYVKINDRFSGDGIKLSEKAYQTLNFSSSARAAATIYQEE